MEIIIIGGRKHDLLVGNNKIQEKNIKDIIKITLKRLQYYFLGQNGTIKC